MAIVKKEHIVGWADAAQFHEQVREALWARPLSNVVLMKEALEEDRGDLSPSMLAVLAYIEAYLKMRLHLNEGT